LKHPAASKQGTAGVATGKQQSWTNNHVIISRKIKNNNPKEVLLYDGRTEIKV